MENYRPMSTLAFISKLIERVAFSRLSDYSARKKLFDPVQTADRHFHSSETALLKVVNYAFLAVDSKKVFMLTLSNLVSKCVIQNIY
jgi:hypothetical protein